MSLGRAAPTRGRICLGCRDQMGVPIPIRGPLAIPFRLVGISQSKMNPNICTICERAFRRVKKRRHITGDATILFADIRGYTALSERLSPGTLADVVQGFQDACARGIWERDGIVNRQMGDGLMAIFNFPIRNASHAEAAIAAAYGIQEGCRQALSALAGTLDIDRAEGIGVGVGIHTGEVEIGEFSSDRSDFTAIGGAVNLAARLESAAAPGEVLASRATLAAAPAFAAGATPRHLTLKGFATPVEAFALASAG